MLPGGQLTGYPTTTTADSVVGADGTVNLINGSDFSKISI